MATASAIEATPASYGEVFTRPWVAETILDLTGYRANRDLGGLHLVEPSCGSGAFLGPVVQRLLTSAKAHGRGIATLGNAIRAYDLQERYVTVSRDLCTRLLAEAGAAPDVAHVLAHKWVVQADFLLDDASSAADVVVGNPPYVRYDNLAESTAALYRNSWGTMRGRSDIYVGFIERGLQMLLPGGRLGIICADRWMRNQYGQGLRSLISSKYAVEHVWTMHDVDAFESSVSAYPAITVIANCPQAAAIVAETTSEFGAQAAARLVAATTSEGFREIADESVTAHRLPHWFEGDGLWPTGPPARLKLIEDLNDRLGLLHSPSTGTRVSIGVASGADRIYITKDHALVEADRLLPLAMSADLASGVFNWQGHYLVNPWGDDGKLISLTDYPRLKAYLAKHEQLRDRHVAKRRPSEWYRTIDKVSHPLTDMPKLLLQDMKASIQPVFEPGGHYPHHNLYYVISDTWDLEVLGGLLLSRIAQAFIEAYCVKMRGGTLRFQSQYLKRIRVPDPDSLDNATSSALRKAFRTRDINAATNAAAVAYGIRLEDYELE